MKRNFILLFILILSNIVFSQDKGIVYYGFIDAIGVGNAKGPDYNAYMVFNKEQSYYVTCKDSLENINLIDSQKVYESDDNNMTSVQNGLKVSRNGDQVVYNISKKTIWSSLLYSKMIYVGEKVPQLNWKIEKETKKIGNFICKKATTSFRGRNYIVWFTSEIPLPFGPWKLQGLPGLILEAYDTQKNVYWYFKSVEYPTKSKEKVKYMSKPIKEPLMSYEEFKKFQINEREQNSDNVKLMSKQFQGVTFKTPELKEMFIECE